MRLLGLIPARGGSRRIPDKNVAPLGGRPLLGWTCEAALASQIFDALYINTDSPTIARIAAQYGVLCPALRPPHLADDQAPTRAAVAWMLELLAARGEHYDALAILQPTSPLRSAEDLRGALRIFEEHAPCAVVGVSPVAPVGWTGTLARDGQFERWAGEDTLYRLNGAIYLYRSEDYLKDVRPRKTIAYPMPAMRGLDIDTPEDLELARALLPIVRRSPAGARAAHGSAAPRWSVSEAVYV